MNTNISFKLFIIMSLFMTIDATCNQTANSSNITCGTCKFLVNIIDHEIEVTNKTIGIITNDIKQICSMIHGPSAKECEMVVTDIQEIVNWITKGFNSTEICYKLHLCPQYLDKFYNIIMIDLLKNKIDLKPVFNKTFEKSPVCFSKETEITPSKDFSNKINMCCSFNSTNILNDTNKIYMCNTKTLINILTSYDTIFNYIYKSFSNILISFNDI